MNLELLDELDNMNNNNSESNDDDNIEPLNFDRTTNTLLKQAFAKRNLEIINLKDLMNKDKKYYYKNKQVKLKYFTNKYPKDNRDEFEEYYNNELKEYFQTMDYIDHICYYKIKIINICKDSDQYSFMIDNTNNLFCLQKIYKNLTYNQKLEYLIQIAELIEIFEKDKDFEIVYKNRKHSGRTYVMVLKLVNKSDRKSKLVENTNLESKL